MAATNEPSIRAYIGATGSGKGVSVGRYLAELKPSRLVVWDPQEEWGHLGQVVSDPRQVQALMSKPAFKVVFRPGDDAKKFPDLFGYLCSLVYLVGNCAFLVEELADVTQPSWAPPAWRRVSTSGRHRGLQVIACSQRPALVDKTFFGNCTYIRCFTLREVPDQRRMAQSMGVDLATIAGLQTLTTESHVIINAFERDYRAGKAGPVVVKLPKKRGG